MRKTPKILFFLPGLSMGGAERQTADLLFGLRALGFDTSLLVFGPMRSPAMLQTLTTEDFVQLDADGMLRPTGWWRAFHALRRADADIVVAVNQTPAVITTFLTPLLRKRWKVAIIFHTTLLPLHERLRHFLFEWAVQMADLLLFVSNRQSAYWRLSGLRPRKATVVLNGVDQGRFVPDPRSKADDRAKLGLNDAEVVFGMIATFRPEKAHLDVILAFRRLCDTTEHARLVLVGDGPTRGGAEQQVRQLGLAERVIFAGEQADVREWIRLFDVGLLCSRRVETFSLAALEMLSSGVPMVMSDIGGAAEIVTDGSNGFLVAAGDEDNLLKAMSRLLDPDLRTRMSAAARPSVSHLTTNAMVASYAAQFHDLLDAVRPSQ